MSRELRRLVMQAKPMRADQLRCTRLAGDSHVLVGVEEPGYVRLSIPETIALADTLLGLAGQTDEDEPS